MHIREPGFLLLISGDTPFEPVPWFDEGQRGRAADVSWPDLWQGFRREVRRLSASDLERICGPAVGAAPAIAFGKVDAEPQRWTEPDRLLIGEFLRRHHARLAHEIAIYGFPGIDKKLFPALAEDVPGLADAIGVTARSHNEDLRVAADYLEEQAPGDLRPGGSVQLYLMGLLRIADYFQVDVSRATPLLLHLREPQSPLSVEEWDKHQAISDISWNNKDPHAAMVRVSPRHTLRTHLQLGELIDSLQRELDVTAAVLSESYGGTDLAALQLTLQRVKTNLHEPALHRQLDFVPRKGGLRSAEDLFRLVVGDLYGDESAVAGRELLQNAIDAVRELEGWLERKGTGRDEIETYDLPADVLVEVEEVDDEMGLFRIRDTGIGMTPGIIIDSFLVAGATFREPVDEEDLDPAAALRWMKAGRFGVGVLASFLLGTKVMVSTRHAGAAKGVTFEADFGDDLVQLNWSKDLPVGTEITIPFEFDRLPTPYEWGGDPEERYLYLLEQIAGFYHLMAPTVAYRFIDRRGRTADPQFERDIPAPDALPDSWRAIEAAGFDAVLWSLPLPPHGFRFGAFPSWRGFDVSLAHNGFLIRKPLGSPTDEAYEWSSTNMKRLLAQPSVAIFDTRNNLGVTLNRYELTERTLKFENDLLQSIGTDIVAHALTCGPDGHPLGGTWGLRPITVGDDYLPLLPALTDRYLECDLVVCWTEEGSERDGAAIFDEAEVPETWARVALSLEELYVDDDFDDNPMDISGVSERMSRSTISLGLLLKMEPIAGVELKPGADATAIDFEGADEGAQQVLGALALGSPSPSVIGFSVLRRQEESLEPRDEVVAAPWIRTLDGMLARGADRRAALASELAPSDENLRNLLETWQRQLRVDHAEKS
jgi:molecular chaperone HtpG